MLAKYLSLLFIIGSYLIGFANIGILFFTGIETKNPKLRSAFLLFLSLGLYMALASMASFNGVMFNLPLGAEAIAHFVILSAANSGLLFAARNFLIVASHRPAQGFGKFLLLGLASLPMAACLIGLVFTGVFALPYQSIQFALSVSYLASLAFGLSVTVAWRIGQTASLRAQHRRIVNLAMAICPPLIALDVISTCLNQRPDTVFGPTAFAHLAFCIASLMSVYLVTGRFTVQLKLVDEGIVPASALDTSYIPVSETRNLQKFGITERERQIIALVCRGCSNRDIANTLFIEPVTVKNHLYKIYQKTRVNNRVGLNNFYLQSQLALSRQQS